MLRKEIFIEKKFSFSNGLEFIVSRLNIYNSFNKTKLNNQTNMLDNVSST